MPASCGKMGRMSRDWGRLAAAVRTARANLKLTQAELARLAGTSESTVQLLESGEKRARLPRSLPAIERALQWAPGSAVTILDGGTPTRLKEESPAPPPKPAHFAEGIPLRVKSELAGDRAVVEAAVIEGPGDTRFAIVWTAGADVDPSEITPEALKQWTRLNRAARGLPVNEGKSDG